MPSLAWLILAISLEVTGTLLLKASNEFTNLWPTLGMTVCYALSFYLLSVSLRGLPLGIAYAIWAGLGIVLVTAIAWWQGQRLDLPAVAGVSLIVAGVLVINLLSRVTPHN